MVELKMRPSCFLVQLLIRCFRISDFSTSTPGFPPIWKMYAAFVHLLKETNIKDGWPELLGFVFQKYVCLKKPWICSSQEGNPIFLFFRRKSFSPKRRSARAKARAAESGNETKATPTLKATRPTGRRPRPSWIPATELNRKRRKSGERRRPRPRRSKQPRLDFVFV